jgi:DNA-binding CsgD family transcriptional regulator
MSDAIEPTVHHADTPLSERELEVAQKLVTGASNAEIARELVISPHTVKVHLRNIFEKLEVNSRTEATMVLLQRGWVSVPGVVPVSEEEAPPDPAPLPDMAVRPYEWQRFYMLGALLAVLLALGAPALLSRNPAPANLLSDGGVSVIGPPVITVPPRWEARTPLTEARSRLAAVVSENFLYVIGGEGKNGATLDRTTVYDLRFNEWTDVAALPRPAANVAAATLGGRIFVAGGSLSDGEGGTQIYDDFWVYDPEEDHWASLGKLPVAVAGAALVADSEALYLLGGWDGQQMRNDVWRYTPDEDASAQGAWELITRLDVPRAFFGAAMLEQDIYIVGGYDGQRDLDAASVYSLATNTWRDLPALATARSGHALVYDGLAIFALGGGWHTPVSTHERYDPATGVWSNFPSPIEDQWRHLAAVAQGERIHLLGGWSGDYLDTHLQYQSSFRTLLPVITNE